jgi:hypothetical protein
MSSEPHDPSDPGTSQEPHEDLLFRAQRTPEEVPGFIDRALERLYQDPPDGDFTIDGVDFEMASGVWLAPIGVYDPDEDTAATPTEIAAGANPTGPWGVVMLDWEIGVRRAMRSSWGAPVLHAPRLVGLEQEPEGILDYLMVAQEFEEAELWDRGDYFAALLTRWKAEPGASFLTQVLVLLPRSFVMQGMAGMMTEDHTRHELLMYGEAPLEIRRRAWLMSTMTGAGEERLRDAPLAATRCSLRATDGRTTVWTFADDGRALLLVLDPSSALVELMERRPASDEEAREGRSEADLILMKRLLDGVPEDLRACIPARAETVRGEIAEHVLEFGLLDDQPVPIISGAFWFDGEVWHTSRGLLRIGQVNGFGMDDYGFGSAVRRPYRLGGTFTVDDVAAGAGPDRRAMVARVFDACPFPEQPRPEGDVRLGYAIPSSADQQGLVEAIERATDAWWERDPGEANLGDDTFVVGGRTLRRAGDRGVLAATLGQAEAWTMDALQAWTNRLGGMMTDRWGPSKEIRTRAQNGTELRSPLSRVMRGTGLTAAPMWWVNGHGVLLLAGIPDPDYSSNPTTLLVLCQADTVLELLGRSSIWEMRLRARIIKDLARLVAEADGEVIPPHQLAAQQPIAWSGPALTGSGTVPLATRGGLRAGTFRWAWHFTHDGRALMTSHEIDGGPHDFAEQVDLFTGVPEDLLSLVADREPAGPYPVVRRDGEPAGPGPLGEVTSLPAATAVFFHDGDDWRASTGTLRRVRAVSIADGVDPLDALYSTKTGVAQLRWALGADGPFSAQSLADPERGRLAFGRAVLLDEARAAFEQLVPALQAALTGTLDEVLDVVVDAPGYRGVLDAALSNPDPRNRREIALWLLGEGVDASVQLSFMTPVNVLLQNPTLDGEDAAVLRRLLESGADAGYGLLGPRPGGHPLVQLCDRDTDEAALEPLLDALLEAADGETARYDVTAPLLPDGRSILQYVSAGDFPHARSRERLRQRLAQLA